MGYENPKNRRCKESFSAIENGCHPIGRHALATKIRSMPNAAHPDRRF